MTKGEIQVMKVKGEGNLADALTKPLEGLGTKKHLDLSGQEIIAGRHELIPEFATEEQEAGRTGCEQETTEEGQEEDWLEDLRMWDQVGDFSWVQNSSLENSTCPPAHVFK